MWPIVLVFVLLVVLLLYLDCRKPRNYPPGPLWYPIVGSALAVHRARHRTGMLCKAMQSIMRQHVGPHNNGVLGLKVGKDRLVVAIGSEAIREMMTNEDLDGRPTGPFYETRTWGSRKGILLTDGDFWVEQRRFLVRHLKEFGFARRGMVEMIQLEAQHLFEDFRDMVDAANAPPTTAAATPAAASPAETVDGVPAAPIVGVGGAMVTMQDAFGRYILNTLWTMMAGIRYGRRNVQLLELQRMLHTLFTNIDMMGCLFSHFPLLRFVAPRYSGYKQFVEIHETMHAFLGRELDNHKRRLRPNDVPNDLMDVYLQVLQQPDRKKSFTEKQLLAVCLDMFIAGSETTTKTMGFAMLHIIRDGGIQRRIQDELDAVVGRGRLPLVEDRASMPYCEAVILEALRLFMAHTFGIPHRAMRDTKLRGYDIPKDAMVIACFAGMMVDDPFWSEPLTFRPERFLNADHTKVVVPELYQPFGVGKHRCMGELMARANLFLFITTLLQNFTFTIPPGHALPAVEPLDGATPSVRQYTALVTRR